jgi:tetratricopeptide (TPR) repeat protein
LVEFAKKHPEQRRQTATVLEEIDALGPAEQLFREDMTDPQSEAALALAEFLARHGRVSEGLALCEGAWKKCKPELVAASSLYVARTGGARTTELQALKTRLEAAAAQKPDSTPLAQARAELAELRGSYEESLVLYQDLLRRNSDYIPALNNRAWLLALGHDRGPEALRLINRVIELTGPVANYLDTRAIVYLAAGQPALAIADMEEAIRQSPVAPFYLHLADARLSAGDRTGAVAALREAKNRGLSVESVHPLERDRSKQLLTELEKQ